MTGFMLHRRYLTYDTSFCDARFNVGICTLDEHKMDFWHRESYIEELVSFHANRFEETDFTNLTRKYGLSFYWSALTLTTLGEQPWPNNSIEMCFEITNTLVGLMLFSGILGYIGSMVTQINFVRSTFEDFKDGCKLYMDFRGVDRFIEKRILEYLDFSWFQGDTTLDEMKLSETLPNSLYSQIIASVHLDSFKKVELFHNCEPAVLHELIKRLRLRIFSPNDFVCHKNEIGKASF
ncbi:Cyclic nucleotide-gated cation channel alpha-3 [Aphelenchoides bicaudatus]|nr:Cyclic nucleotide-gated cation channel alpha-3 [Aphelenchoides bicaudatus]